MKFTKSYLAFRGLIHIAHPSPLGRWFQSWEAKAFDLCQCLLMEVVVECDLDVFVASRHPCHVDFLPNVVDESEIGALPPSMKVFKQGLFGPSVISLERQSNIEFELSGE